MPEAFTMKGVAQGNGLALLPKNTSLLPSAEGLLPLQLVPRLCAASVMRENLPSLYKVIKRRKITWIFFPYWCVAGFIVV